MPGKQVELLHSANKLQLSILPLLRSHGPIHLPMSIFLPPCSTGGNGLPVATRALPSVQSKRSCGLASCKRVGLLKGKIIGRFTCLDIARTTFSSKAFGFVDVPIRTWGSTRSTTESRSCCLLAGHSSESLANGTWAGFKFSPCDWRRRPGLSMHL